MGLIGFVSSHKPLRGVAEFGVDLGFHATHQLLHYRKQDGKLQFIAPSGYENVYVYAAKRTMMQLSFAKINNLYAEYRQKLDNKKMVKAFQDNQQKHMQTIISKTNDKENEDFNKQGVRLYYMGKPAPEGLVLWIGKQVGGQTKRVPINTYYDKIRNLSFRSSEIGKISTTVEVPQDAENVFVDFGAVIRAQSNNNVVLTKVQGRDYSRKEMISGGDVVFTVSGKIVSNYPDVYPYAAVATFISLMKHSGIIKVSNLMFQQFNVDRVIIRDFQLSPEQGYKNSQPYTFTCVAVEPDEEVKAMVDTIVAENIYIGASAKKGWTTKLLQKIKDRAAKQATQMAAQLASKYI